MGGVSALKFVLGILLIGLTSLLGQSDQLTGAAGHGKHALVIANSAYRHLPALRTPRANAAAVASALENVHIEPVVAYDLSQGELIGTIQKFLGSIGRDDFVLIYFSGYGYQADELNYLLPITFDPADESSLGQRAISLRYLQSQLDQRGAGTRMLILDASRPCPGAPDGLANMPPASKTLLAFSAAPNVSVADPPDGGVNSFTAALISAIAEPGSTPVRVLLRAQSDLERESGGKQFPFLMQAPVETFYFTEPALPPALPAPATAVPVLTELKPGQSRENSKDRLIYAWIPPGTFQMGCVPDDTFCLPDEKPRHEVTIAKGFWIARTEVTAEAYQRFTSETKHPSPKKSKTNPKQAGTDLPVTGVSWDDAKTYCAWAGGRLPTEAEWEYSARGGKPDWKYPWGDKFDSQLANMFHTDLKLKAPFIETVPVRRLGSGNGFDLFDVAGNAREWTSDYYDRSTYSATPPFVDPAVAAGAKEVVVRGGSFYSSEKDLRLSARDHLEPAKGDNQTGFRCVIPSLAAAD